jgi:1,2-diacylglycerol 3-beta-glucosyltransferase
MTELGMVWLAAGLPVLTATGYLLLLTMASRRPNHVSAAPAWRRVVVVVPAHNEADGIGATVDSLLAVDYPAARRRVLVVADNCTDATARVAAERGASVLERADAERRGKGYALEYAFEHLLASGAPEWDAVVVVDADTLVEPTLLTALTARLQTADAVQAAYLPRPGRTSPTAVITDVALTAFHLVRSSARERFGWSCGLRGNGMAFSRSLLERVRHTAFSRTEDLEFGVLLGLQGVRVAYAGDTTVYGDMPDRAEVVTQQRDRWIGGRVAMARRWAGPLLAMAVRRRSGLAADLAVDLVLPPLSALLVVLALGVPVAAGIAWLGGGVWPLVLWTAALVMLVVHVGHAAVLAGRGRDFLRALLTVPRYAVDKARLVVRGVRTTDDSWIRTTREGELS